MNDTSNSSSLSDVLKNNEILTTFHDFWLAFFIFLPIVLFPFYVYVNRVNRERDKNTLVFPMIIHFYKMMKVTQAIYCIIYFTYVCTALTDGNKNEQTLVTASILDDKKRR
ncbi:unnamed protein product [Caenorhabditis nigoni]